MLRKWMYGIACFVLAAVLGFGCAAEEIDLKSLSDEVFTTLVDDVMQEMVSRGLEKTATLSKGTYTVGKDLPCGSYVYTCLATGSDWGSLTVYSEEGKGEQLMWEVLSAPEEDEAPESFFITLNEGDQLKSGVPFSLTISGGVIFR